MTAQPIEQKDWHIRFWFVACGVVLLVQILVEYAMGRGPICTCGYVKLWEGQVNSPGNSQHISDWYTPSHIIHGFLFYALTRWRLPGRTFSLKLFVAMLFESGWEIIENSPWIINRYRDNTVSLQYYGDSILNSGMDTLFMVAGFLFAWRAPIWLTILIAVFFELFTGWMIRDNLTLNVLMLVWPIDAVKQWQSALG